MCKIAAVVGARPQIIKTAPVISKLQHSKKCTVLVIHTGQHYDYELSKVFFKELELPEPAVNLGIRESTQARQTAAMMVGLERVLPRLRPDVVLVPGDTNSALAAALTAVKLRIPCAHLEGGPRQFDLSNPEEANRIVVDHLSTIAFAPTQLSFANLRREGFDERRAILSGDTMLDSLIEHLDSAVKIDLGSRYGFDGGFILTTIHRQENTDDATKLRAIVRSLIRAKTIDFVFPLHPRTRKNLKCFSLWTRLKAAQNVRLIQPVDYETNLALTARSSVVLTDSGGLQKEAFWLGVPCVTVFKTTAWPETLAGGANRCIEPDEIPQALSDTASIRFNRRRSFSSFGNGKASSIVCKTLLRLCGH